MGNVNKKPQQTSETLQLLHESSSTIFTCEICIEPVTHPNDIFNNSNRCVHPFCTNCIIKYIQVRLEDNVSDVKCPALTCDHSLEPLSCRPKIPRQLFDKWCDVLCESEVLNLDRVYCPNQECSVLVINECGSEGSLKKYLCPGCKKPFCFRCKATWHAGYSCEEVSEIVDPNDVAFGVLSENERWMRCPLCRHCVERVTGCHIVRCRCGILFCYTCGRKADSCVCGSQTCFRCCEVLAVLFLLCMTFIVVLCFMHIYKII